jgi:hypothetical protein
MEIKRLAPAFDHGFSMDTTPALQNDFTQKLTGKSNEDEVKSIEHLQWCLETDIRPVDLIRRVSENYTNVHERAKLLHLATGVGKRFSELRDRADQLAKQERYINTGSSR